MLWSDRLRERHSAETRRARVMVARGGWLLACLLPVLMVLVVGWRP